ncbi:cardiolipin synthase [Bacillus canaveralius]|uniref:Cardiolipin synthase n=1 Tax=Bacillus canaveralius TaxID=1403243 RepID=A0A2N5GGF5_9BACI|nr:cardiolipin synthase [Bacillus canaveralius]PLR79780.1 cardiolipin synthase [Bacillus canaveralius]PLR94513.1 cardiolipin synthase [Bacillus canaveralius]
MKILLIILGALLLLAIWISLDFQFGRKAQLARITRINYPIRESNLQIFTTGPELFSDYFSLLKNANHHIHILFYIVKVDLISKEFFAILKSKAQSGVEVRLLLDWMGCRNISRRVIEDLKRANIKFAFCHIPRLPFLFYSSQVRNHRKMTIIDGKTGYMGGFNIGKEYIDQDPKLKPWRDYHLKISGEGAADLQREFLKDWRMATKTNLLNNSIYFPELEKGNSRHQVLPSEGFYLEETFSTLIRKAESTIIIGTPYFIPSKRIFADLLKALKRGVRLKVLVPHMTDHLFVKEASFRYLRRLIQEGAEVYDYMKGFYHAKVIVIDDKICDIGTANFDKRSIFLNHEINCFIFDRAFIERVRNILEIDLLNSKQITLSELNKPNLLRSIKEQAAKAISFFL